MKNYLYIIVILLIFLSCNIDHGIEPILSHVQGVITYSGEWPAPAAEVRLVAATEFPPSGIDDLIIGESIPITGDCYNYKFYLKPNTYKIIGVAWREQDSVWDIISVCGLYFSGEDSLAPGEITIASDTSQVNDIDIFVNRSTAHQVTDSKINGSITFEGTRPDSISDAYVIATTKFSLFPTVLPSLLDISFSNSIPIHEDSVSYTINAFPGKYVATGVLFFKSGQSLSLDDILYSLSVNGLDFMQYEVQADSTVAGPDFQIKF